MSLLPQILQFNTHRRDAMVAQFAASLPAGTRVLDIGAGPCRYRPLFAHCSYHAQDFARYEGDGFKYGELDYVCDITSIPAPDSSFDAILSSMRGIPFLSRHGNLRIKHFGKYRKCQDAGNSTT